MEQSRDPLGVLDGILNKRRSLDFRYIPSLKCTDVHHRPRRNSTSVLRSSQTMYPSCTTTHYSDTLHSSTTSSSILSEIPDMDTIPTTTGMRLESPSVTTVADVDVAYPERVHLQSYLNYEAKRRALGLTPLSMTSPAYPTKLASHSTSPSPTNTINTLQSHTHSAVVCSSTPTVLDSLAQLLSDVMGEAESQLQECMPIIWRSLEDTLGTLIGNHAMGVPSKLQGRQQDIVGSSMAKVVLQLQRFTEWFEKPSSCTPINSRESQLQALLAIVDTANAALQEETQSRAAVTGLGQQLSTLRMVLQEKQQEYEALASLTMAQGDALHDQSTTSAVTSTSVVLQHTQQHHTTTATAFLLGPLQSTHGSNNAQHTVEDSITTNLLPERPLCLVEQETQTDNSFGNEPLVSPRIEACSPSTAATSPSSQLCQPTKMEVTLQNQLCVLAQKLQCYNDTIQQKEEQEQHLKDQIQLLQAEVCGLGATVNDKETQLEQLKKINNEQLQHAEWQKEKLAELCTLQSHCKQLEESNTRLVELQSHCKQLEGSNTRLVEDINTLKQEKQNVVNELEGVMADNHQLSTELQELNSSLTDKHKALAALQLAQESEVQQFQNEVQALKMQLTVQLAKDALKPELIDIGVNTDQDARMLGLKQQLHDAESKRNLAEAQLLQSSNTIGKLQNQTDVAKKHKEVTERQLQNTIDQLTEMERSYQHLQAQYTTTHNDYSRCQAELIAEKGTTSDNGLTIKCLEERIKCLDTELREMTNKLIECQDNKHNSSMSNQFSWHDPWKSSVEKPSDKRIDTSALSDTTISTIAVSETQSHSLHNANPATTKNNNISIPSTTSLNSMHNSSNIAIGGHSSRKGTQEGGPTSGCSKTKSSTKTDYLQSFLNATVESTTQLTHRSNNDLDGSSSVVPRKLFGNDDDNTDTHATTTRSSPRPPQWQQQSQQNGSAQAGCPPTTLHTSRSTTPPLSNKTYNLTSLFETGDYRPHTAGEVILGCPDSPTPRSHIFQQNNPHHFLPQSDDSGPHTRSNSPPTTPPPVTHVSNNIKRSSSPTGGNNINTSLPLVPPAASVSSVSVVTEASCSQVSLFSSPSSLSIHMSPTSPVNPSSTTTHSFVEDDPFHSSITAATGKVSPAVHMAWLKTRLQQLGDDLESTPQK